MTKIPVSNNLSTEVNDLVGYLDVPQDMADNMAACFGEGLGFKLDACVQKDGDTFKLLHVSIVSVSGQPEVKQLFDGFAKAYKYNTQMDGDGDYVSESTQKAFVAFKNGFEHCGRVEMTSEDSFKMLVERVQHLEIKMQRIEADGTPRVNTEQPVESTENLTGNLAKVKDLTISTDVSVASVDPIVRQN